MSEWEWIEDPDPGAPDPVGRALATNGHRVLRHGGVTVQLSEHDTGSPPDYSMCSVPHLGWRRYSVVVLDARWRDAGVRLPGEPGVSGPGRRRGCAGGSAGHRRGRQAVRARCAGRRAWIAARRGARRGGMTRPRRYVRPRPPAGLTVTTAAPRVRQSLTAAAPSRCASCRRCRLAACRPVVRRSGPPVARGFRSWSPRRAAERRAQQRIAT